MTDPVTGVIFTIELKMEEKWLMGRTLENWEFLNNQTEDNAVDESHEPV